MDTSRLILRWAIPGWLLELLFFGFVAAHFVWSGKTLTISRLCSGDQYGALFAAITALTGLGLPLGFLVFQFYYFLYWAVPLPLVKTPQDRGYTILQDCEYDLLRLFGRDLDRRASTARGWRIGVGRLKVHVVPPALLRRYQHNWTLADSAWAWLLLKHPAPQLQARAEALRDMYQNLGTSLTAGGLAYVAYVIYEVAMHPGLLASSARPWIAFGVNALCLSNLIVWLRKTRRDALYELEMLEHDLITALSREDARRQWRSGRPEKRSGERGRSAARRCRATERARLAMPSRASVPEGRGGGSPALKTGLVGPAHASRGLAAPCDGCFPRSRIGLRSGGPLQSYSRSCPLRRRPDWRS